MSGDKFEIRRARPNDASAIHEAHMRSIREICSQDHTADEIRGWGNRPFNRAERVQFIENSWVWVLTKNNLVQGYGHLVEKLENQIPVAYVVALYFTPEVTGLGWGRKLMNVMISSARSKQYNFLYLQSTITSHEFYKKLGFIDTGPQELHLINGSKVRCFPMRLDLSR